MNRVGGSSSWRSALLVGSVRHRRRRPAANAFRYDVFHALLDVDELPDLDRQLPGFGYNRPAVTGFRDTDHFGPAPVPVRLKLARWLAAQGVELPAGRVQVVCNLRVLGHVFDPVSWWFCHEPDGTLAFVVAEVNNTFGESHSYLLDDLEVAVDGTVRAAADKVFHVSPFLPVDGHRYRFTFRPPTATGAPTRERVLVHMDVDDADGKLFDATQDERRVALTAGNLRRALRRYPLVTLRTVYLIHRQALTLWRKRVAFHPKPAPPDDGYAVTAVPTATVAPPRTSAARAIPAPDDHEPEPVAHRAPTSPVASRASSLAQERPA